MFRNLAAFSIRRLFGGRNNAGNVPALPRIFPNWRAPIVRTSEADRELTTAY